MRTENKNSLKTLNVLLSYMRSDRPAVFISILLSLVSTAASLIIPIYCGKAIDCLIGVNKVNFDEMVKDYIVIMACIIIFAVVQWVMGVVNNKITYSLVRNIRSDLFDTCLGLDMSYIDSHRHGGIVSRIIGDVDQMADGILMALNQFFTSIFTLAGTIILMISINPSITLIVVILTPLSLIFAATLAKKTYGYFKEQSEKREELTSYINEISGEQKTIRAYSAEEEVLVKFRNINSDYMRASKNAVFYSSLVNPTTRFINNIIYAMVCLFGALTVVDGGLTVGALSSILAFSGKYAKPFNEISGIVTELQNALACAERAFEFIGIKDKKRLYDGHVLSESHENRRDGMLSLRNISFSYSKDKQLINDFNLDLGRNEHLAIVGPTGCGKTTLVNLILKFYNLDSGDIRFDDKSIYDTDVKELYTNFGLVLQDTWIMRGTVRDNIAMGREADDEMIISAAKRAFCHSFITKLPDGYNTVIDDESGLLSEGQRQLICIARIILYPPRLIFLDEATSSIDTRTELKIQALIEEITHDRSSFIIAHRLATIKNSDRILVMNQGKIIEEGNHESLFAKNGYYRKMWDSGYPRISRQI